MNERSRARARGKDNERQIVDDLYHRGFTSAKRVPLSGALKDQPGDVVVEDFSLLLEAKVYNTLEIEGARYFRIDLNWLWKVVDEAKRIGFRHASVVIRGKNLRRRAVIMDWSEYLDLISKVERIS